MGGKHVQSSALRNGSRSQNGSIHRRPASYSISATELLEKEYPPIRWAIEGILPEGLAILAGKTKIGKSWLALHWSLQVANQGDVLYLALEDSERRLKDRINKLLPHVPTSLDRLTLAPMLSWPRMDEGKEDGLERLDHWLSNHPGAGLVVIDTLTRFRPVVKGKTNYDKDSEVMARIQALALKHQTTILLLHHTTKRKAQDVIDEMAGTVGTPGIADTLMVLSRERSSPQGKLLITGRDVGEVEYPAQWKGDSCLWVFEMRDIKDFQEQKPPQEQKSSKVQEAIIWLERKLQEGPVPKPVLMEMAKDDGLSLETVEDGRRARGGINTVYQDGQYYWQLEHTDTQKAQAQAV